MDDDIVITGIGIFSPSGVGRDAFWQAVRNGKTGFGKISLFDTSGFNVHTGGEIPNFDPVEYLGKKGLRTLDRSTMLICSAAELALKDARLEITEANNYSTGVAIGTTFGSLHSISQFDLEGLREGPRYVNPSLFPNTVINSPASNVSIRFGIKGFNTTISTGFCASLDSIIYASDFIKLNRADAVLAGGVEELCEETFLMFHNMGYLSGSNGDTPICCPYDARRNGFILSEGAAILVIESGQAALDRGASILSHIKGCGNAFDPSAQYNYGTGTGMRNAVTAALNNAGFSPDDIDYICGCANSTKELDRIESRVVQDIFGDRVPVSSVKSMTGETFSASGAIALCTAAGALDMGVIPPTMNYNEKDPECCLDYVPNEARKKQINTALVLSSDPYGNNSAVILAKH